MGESFHSLRRSSKLRLLPFLLLESALLASSLLGTAPLSAQNTPQKIQGRDWASLAQAPDLGEVEKGRRFHLSVSLPLRNTGELDQFLKAVCDPKSPTYRHFLRPGEFGGLYGPAPQDAQAVADYFAARGFTVTKIHSNRVIVDVEGDNDAVEKAFHVRLRNHRRPDGTTFYSPDGTPQVDFATPLDHVSGLENYHPPRRAGQAQLPGGGQPQGGAGPGGSSFGIDFRNAYAGGVTLKGQGESVALFELSTYYTTDTPQFQAVVPTTSSQAATMYASFGPLSNIYLDGWSSSTPPSGNDADEVAIDIDMVYSMAPAAGVSVYMGSNADDVLNQIAEDDSCPVISASWTYYPVGSAFAQFAAQGQSYLNASMDGDAYTAGTAPNLSYEVVTPYGGFNLNFPDITLVGGTSLSMNGTAYGSESVWNNGGGTGGGGGVMTLEAIPWYQANVSMASNGGSTTDRNAPDVAACAVNIYGYEQGNWGTHWGTSFATPLWAGFIALANQQAAAQGEPRLGFLNPVIYAIGQDPVKYAADFHDVSSGNNSGYNAVTGFDLATGWGSPNGQSLINDLLQTTGVPTVTSTPVNTGTPTLTWTQTHTGTPTPTATASATSTNSVTATITATPTFTGTPTATGTSTLTATFSSTPTITFTPTSTNTPTVTFTPTATPKPLVVYPNPVSGSSARLQLPSNAGSRVKVDLFTVAFRRVKTVEFDQVPLGTDISFDLVDQAGVGLANGLYYVRVTTGGISRTAKLLVLR